MSRGSDLPFHRDLPHRKKPEDLPHWSRFLRHWRRNPAPTAAVKILLLANSDWFLHRFNGELIRTLHRTGSEVVLAGPRGDYSRRFEAEGLPWRPWRVSRRRLLPWQEMSSLWQLRRLLRRERPDVVHAFTLKTALYSAAVCALPRSPQLVCSITGLGYLYANHGLRAKLLRRLLLILGRRLFPRHQMIFLNRDDFQELRRAGLVAAGRGTVIGGSGVDLQRFSVQPWCDDGPPWVVLPARMLHSKGIEDFVHAAAALRDRGSNARFALVGDLDADSPDGIAGPLLEDWCRRCGVEYWGFRDDMIGVYRRAAIVCLPSFYREGVPTVLLEAAACGRPVVTTDMPGCRDAVQDGVSGRLVPPRDTEALERVLASLLAAPQDLRRMGQAARRRVEERFSVQRVVEATLAVYRRCGFHMDMPEAPRLPPRPSDEPATHMSHRQPREDLST